MKRVHEHGKRRKQKRRAAAEAAEEAEWSALERAGPHASAATHNTKRQSTGNVTTSTGSSADSTTPTPTALTTVGGGRRGFRKRGRAHPAFIVDVTTGTAVPVPIGKAKHQGLPELPELIAQTSDLPPTNATSRDQDIPDEVPPLSEAVPAAAAPSIVARGPSPEPNELDRSANRSKRHPASISGTSRKKRKKSRKKSMQLEVKE
eukprot:m.211259 g.211259  ORF g.211259 m.211259 type:complete len:205 (+) comp25420_c0_seq1:166-780(+)